MLHASIRPSSRRVADCRPRGTPAIVRMRLHQVLWRIPAPPERPAALLWRRLSQTCRTQAKSGECMSPQPPGHRGLNAATKPRRPMRRASFLQLRCCVNSPLVSPLRRPLTSTTVAGNAARMLDETVSRFLGSRRAPARYGHLSDDTAHPSCGSSLLRAPCGWSSGALPGRNRLDDGGNSRGSRELGGYLCNGSLEQSLNRFRAQQGWRLQTQAAYARPGTLQEVGGIRQVRTVEEEQSHPTWVGNHRDHHIRGSRGCGEAKAESVVVVIDEFVATRKESPDFRTSGAKLRRH